MSALEIVDRTILGLARQGVPRAEYDGLTGVNWSTLHWMQRSPAHYRHAVEHRDDGDTDARKLGRCVHIAVFEPERHAAEVVRWDGGQRRGKDWAAFEEEHAHREILTEREYEECLALQRAVRADPIAGRYIASEGAAEVSVTWTHRVAPIEHLAGWELACKGRLDYVATQRGIIDLKTVRDASPSGFGKSAWQYQLHVQAAMYVDGYAAATGEVLPYLLVAVEKQPPYAVVVYRVPDDVLDLGREEYRRLLSRVRMCREENVWPGYSEGEADLVLPRWAVPLDDDEDAAGLDLAIGGQ